MNASPNIFRVPFLKRFRVFSLLQVYLASGVVVPFLFSTFFFVSFLLTFQMFRVTKLIVNKEVETLQILSLIMHIAVSFLPLTIPVSILFATIYTLNRLSEDAEIVAMRGAGLSKYQLLVPFLWIGAVVALVIFSLNRNLIPYSRRVSKNTVAQLTSKAVLSDVRRGQFYIEIPGVVLFAENVGEEEKELYNVFIQTMPEGETERVIMAKRGQLVKQQDPETKVLGLRMHLYDGNLVKLGPGENVDKFRFQEYDFPIAGMGGTTDKVDKESTRTNAEILSWLSKDLAGYKEVSERTVKKSDDDVLLKNFLRSIQRARIEYWSRMASPFQCLVFVFLGFGLGITPGRGRGRNSGPLTLLILSLYYVVYFSGTAFATKGMIPAWLAVALPLTATFGSSCYFFRKLDWT